MARKLTAKVVDAIKIGKRADVWDSDLRGFGLRINGSGRTYVVRYRTRPAPGSKDLVRLVRYTIGDAEKLSLADARDMAREVLVLVAKGKDPAVERTAARRAARDNAATFQGLAESLIAKADLGERTRYNWVRLLEARIYPKLGTRRPAEISRADVRDLVERIAKDTPTQANDALKILRWVFARAVEADLIPNTPCVGVRKPTKEHPRDRVATDGELRALWAAAESEGLYGLAARLALLTAARREEVFSAQWSEVDLEQKLWRIPGARTKNAAAHEVPLTDAALELVRDLQSQREDGKPWLFPGRVKGQALRPTSKAWEALVLRAKLTEAGLRFHDLRRTVRDRLTRDLAVSAPVAEAVIGHVQPRLIQTYAPSGVALRDKRAALDRWARELLRIVDEEAARTQAGVVLPFAGGREGAK